MRKLQYDEAAELDVLSQDDELYVRGAIAISGERGSEFKTADGDEFKFVNVDCLGSGHDSVLIDEGIFVRVPKEFQYPRNSLNNTPKPLSQNSSFFEIGCYIKEHPLKAGFQISRGLFLDLYEDFRDIFLKVGYRLAPVAYGLSH